MKVLSNQINKSFTNDNELNRLAVNLLCKFAMKNIKGFPEYESSFFFSFHFGHQSLQLLHAASMDDLDQRNWTWFKKNFNQSMNQSIYNLHININRPTLFHIKVFQLQAW